MKKLDRFIRTYRERVVLRALDNKQGAIFDIGCGDGTFLMSLRGQFHKRIGCDPVLNTPKIEGVERVQLIKAGFSEALLGIESSLKFDVFTALAVFEHIPVKEISRIGEEISQRLEDGGILVATVPSPLVDQILHMLLRLKLIEGQEAHQHYGFKPSDLEGLLSPNLRLVSHKRFQVGLNNLFIFKKSD